MKTYFGFVLVFYVLVSCALYFALQLFNFYWAGTITLFAFTGGMIYHVLIESLIDVDDIEKKTTFSEFSSDFKSCLIVGLLAFIPISLVGAGISLICSSSKLYGLGLISAGVFVFWFSHRDKMPNHPLEP